jgi:DNA polymerase-3 subunit gamma/tau
MEILANKYRPKKMSDLIGQDSATRILTNSILSNNLHHTYIFSGKFGCGKTSSARVLAACVNNKNGPTLEPDYSDPDIQAIFEGKSVDVIELDAASNRSIDDVRAIKENIRYSPVALRTKFVIIDEAHRLTGDAAEAALKMLEEPPKNVIFILCTTNMEDLKDTIHSRSMSIRFNKLSWDQLYNNLVKIAKLENIQYDDAALRIAAKLSRGSIRNSLQNLQTMMTFAKGEKITAEIAQSSLSAVDDSKYFELVDMILKPNAGEAMRIIDQLMGDGREVGEVLNGLVGHIRTMLVIKTAQDTSRLIFLTEEEKKKYAAQSANVSIPLLLQMIDLVGEVNKGIALNLNPQTMMEKLIISSIIFNRTEARTA